MDLAHDLKVKGITINQGEDSNVRHQPQLSRSKMLGNNDLGVRIRGPGDINAGITEEHQDHNENGIDKQCKDLKIRSLSLQFVDDEVPNVLMDIDNCDDVENVNDDVATVEQTSPCDDDVDEDEGDVDVDEETSLTEHQVHNENVINVEYKEDQIDDSTTSPRTVDSTPVPTFEYNNASLVSDVFENIDELELAIAENMNKRPDGMWMCSKMGCGKVFKNKIGMTRHVETHIEGISFQCPYCDNKSSKTRNGLRQHLSKHH